MIARPDADLRTLWISDVHLGARNASASALLELLGRVRAERVVLVGDIVDLWSLKRRWHWPRAHRQVLERLHEMARHGTDVFYVPGNHDEAFRGLCGHGFGPIRVERELVHEGVDGRRFLVIHGDELEEDIHVARWAARAGDGIYAALLVADRPLGKVQRAVGSAEPFSLARFVKTRSKTARRFVLRYEVAAVRLARKRGFDGVICGHIHVPQLRLHRGVLYANCGDWMESRTALGETHAGHIVLLRQGRQDVPVLPPMAHAPSRLCREAVRRRGSSCELPASGLLGRDDSHFAYMGQRERRDQAAVERGRAYHLDVEADVLGEAHG
ncbi:MAG: UDP-2,3-diacylglucosamine diphosphatase [Planctomycetota bacterium]